MSYQVIARKYRPQAFADLTGQEHITRTLRHALEGNRLHHAYLFSGVRGTGKTTTARILAKGLNCHRGITSDPCLTCPSCLEIAAGNSMDVLEIDAASNTGVDNVRDVIINNIAMAPARDRFKVFVIDEVHMLSTSAFNALLKTLEEPPAHVVFILATTELHKVPDTILSRCQQFEFRQIPTDKILGRLREIAAREGIAIEDGALREIARAGAGSLRDAQSAFDQVIAFTGTEIKEEDVTGALGLVSVATLARFTEAIAQQRTAELLNLVEEIFSRGYDARNFTRELMAYFRHLLLIKSGIDDEEILGVTEVEVEKLRELAPHFSEADLVRSFHFLAETEKEIKDSPQPRFQLELGLVKLAQLRRLRTLDELIRGLEALASRIGGGGGGGAGSPGTIPAPSQDRGPRESPPARPLQSSAPAQREVKAAAPSLPGPFDPPDFDQSEPLDSLDPYEEAPPRLVKASATVQSHQTSAERRPVSGNEVEAILNELRRINRGFILTALEEAQRLDYRDGALIATFGREDTFAKRIRESGTLFRAIGETIFGRPLRIEVKLSGQVETAVDENEVKRKQLHERAMRIPAVRQFLELTRGEIVSVREPE